MQHAIVVGVCDRPRRQALLVVNLPVDLLHQIGLGDAAVECGISNRRDEGSRFGMCGQSDGLRDLSVDLFDLKEGKVKAGTRLDVADGLQVEDLLVVAADLLEHVD